MRQIRRPPTSPSTGFATIAAMSLALVVAACASSQPASELPITRQEIAGTEASTAFEAVRRLRPGWLRRTGNDGNARRFTVSGAGQRGGASDSRCRWTLYVGEEGVEPDELRRIDAFMVEEVRLVASRSRRPDGSTCASESPILHVVLVGRQG